jgi:uncharacterized protein
VKGRITQWVIKLAKLCNLRCTYCYEFESLADPTRMRPEQLEVLFRNVAAYSAHNSRRSEFVWHGGEPLLAPAGYFEEIFELQRIAFEEAGAEYSNSVQTNLYKLRGDTLDLLRRFNLVGVSIDLFGDMRVTASGASAQQRVLENMDRLRAENVKFGCITVLTPIVAERIDAVFDFYASIGVSFRLLPIYRSAFANQHEAWEMPREDVESTLIRLFDLMMKRGAGISVSPIDGYVSNVLRSFTGSDPVIPYPRGDQPESLFIVDTDGRAYASANAYQQEYAYGNLFEPHALALSRSEGYRKTLSDRRNRLRGCSDCEFRECCNGLYLAEATPEQKSVRPDGTWRCPDAQAVHRHIEQWLLQSEYVDSELGILNVNKLRPYLPASSFELRHQAY